MGLLLKGNKLCLININNYSRFFCPGPDTFYFTLIYLALANMVLKISSCSFMAATLSAGLVRASNKIQPL